MKASRFNPFLSLARIILPLFLPAAAHSQALIRTNVQQSGSLGNSAPISVSGSPYAIYFYGIGGNSANQDDKSVSAAGSSGNIDNFSNFTGAELSTTSFGGYGYGIYLQLQGGTGGDYTNNNANHNAGNGGSAGNLNGTNQAPIRAFGTFSGGFLGIRASSIGGNGGSSATKETIENVPFFDTDIGNSENNDDGQGGFGGNAGRVTLNNSGFLQLGTEDSPLRVQGSSDFQGLSAATRGGAAGVGRTPKGGGVAGDVTVNNSGTINMFLDFNGVSQLPRTFYGIFAKSVGGEGAQSFTDGASAGSGGFSGNVTVNLTAGSDIRINGALSGADPVEIAGAGVIAITEGATGGRGNSGTFSSPTFGGTGGNAGSISLLSRDANFNISGDYIAGMVGTATGGKGGDGSSQSPNHSFSGQGGNAGAVGASFVRNSEGTSTLSTQGRNAGGIVVSNVGGLGGTSFQQDALSGGAAGAGGNGGAVGDVSVTLNATAGQVRLLTNGISSNGIEATSTGGAGGKGGNLNIVTGQIGDDESTAGAAGVGSRSGNVDVALVGDSRITTSMNESIGVLAVATGGNGGEGGKGTIDAGDSEGRTGGRGGDSGNVSITIDGEAAILTSGDNSSAVEAISLSGLGGPGGGAAVGSSESGGGGASGNTGTISIDHRGAVETAGSESYGIFAQVAAGGGGQSGNSSSARPNSAGNGGASGSNGSITITNGGSISTSGEASHGLFAESLGGSGGAGGSSSGAGSLGGSGGVASNGGSVALSQIDGFQVRTSGENAHGVFLHSVGGGGGDGGSGAGFTAVGGDGSGGGIGGAVSATLGTGATTITGDKSFGLFLQSVGGGGGNGGDATSQTLFSAYAVGGGGGAGGNGGTVSLDSSGNFTTSGSRSIAVLGQSVGGGGGNGGAAFSTGVGVFLASGVSVGGSGGVGGDGKDVNLAFNGGTIRTGVYNQENFEATNLLPADAFGVIAQSIGGGGGNGGSAIANAVAIAPPTPELQISVAVSSSLGGSGGAGGNGGNVNLGIFKNTMIATQGQGSHGAIGQSIGGGGGNGGDSSAMAASFGYGRVASRLEAKTFSVDIDHTVGGSGAAGGNGGTVGVTVGAGGTASVQTFGDYSNGIQAQSIGAGGGNGGVGSGTTLGYGSSNSIDLTIALGGSGGAGGNGGRTEADLNPGSFILVAGSGSHAILSHSIGGGGGTSQGGMVSAGAEAGISAGEDTPIINEFAVGGDVSASLGATGGSGGNGGAAGASVFGKVDTYGDDSTALTVQSIGGGGGIAGAAGADASADNPVEVFGTVRSLIDKALFQIFPIKVSKELELGALDSGNAGNGGSATANVGATLTTRGDWSQAAVIQSIGGGGGRGGVATVGDSGPETESTLTLLVGGKGNSIGGSGGEGGGRSTGTGSNGGEASLNANGSTFLTGDTSGSGFGAYGLVVQSIGGGGGIALDGSDANSGTIKVGNGARESVAPRFNESGKQVSRGHSASDGVVSGNGGSVTLTGTPIVTTLGMAAHGIILQSVGAGGGIGGAGTSSANAGQSDIALEVGGAARSTGHGGTVSLAEGNGLRITTAGDNSFGLLAQSIGGGGGLGVALDPTSVSLRGTEDSSGGSNRNFGGNLDLNLSGSSAITTSGDGSHGIVAQSIGGGGGIAGVLSVPGFELSDPEARNGFGNGGVVNLRTDAGSNISTSGRLAHGIVAQAIGGGGGISGGRYGRSSTGGSGLAGSVNLTINGSVSVTGDGSYGVFSQLDAPDIDNRIGTRLTIGGSVRSAGTAIRLVGGDNTVTVANGGLINADRVIEQTAAVDKNGSNFGQTLLVNDGTVVGSISSDIQFAGNPSAGKSATLNRALPESAVSVVNRGVFLAGTSIEADIRNSGSFVIGENPAARAGATTNVAGHFIQRAGGELVFDVDFENSVGDVLRIEGDGRFDGTVRADLRGVVANRDVRILEVNGDFLGELEADNGRREGEFGIYDFSLRREGNLLFISPLVDFSPEGVPLSRNSREVGNYLETLWETSLLPEYQGLFGGLDQLLAGGTGIYDQALRQLSPGASFGFAASAVSSQRAFANAAFGDKALEEGSSKPVEVQSVWARTYGGSVGADDYQVDSFTSDLGAQWEISPDFFLGGALGYQHDSLDGRSDLVSGNGDSAMAAFTVKYEPGDWSFAGALTGAAGEYDTVRRVLIPGHVETYEGSPSVQSLGLVARAGYTFHNETAYFTPQATGSLVYVNSDSYRESGVGNARLAVESESDTVFVFSPGFEAGIRTDLPNGMLLRSYVSGSVNFATGGDWEQNARFAAVPANTGSFSAVLPRDTVSGQVTAGGQIQFTEAVSGYLEYQGQFSEHVNENGGALGVKLRF